MSHKDEDVALMALVDHINQLDTLVKKASAAYFRDDWAAVASLLNIISFKARAADGLAIELNRRSMDDE